MVALSITGLATIGAPFMVNKPRKPLTPEGAALATVLNGALFAAIVVLWRT